MVSNIKHKLFKYKKAEKACKEPYNETFCLTGWCADMYEGNLCKACREGHAVDNELAGTCIKCEDNPLYYVYAFAFMFGAIIFLAYTIRNAIKDTKNFEFFFPIKKNNQIEFYSLFLNNLKKNFKWTIKTAN